MIIDNTEIVRIVTDIESEYNKSTTTTHYAILYSKLAVIEFCGWIEQVFDSILDEYISSKLCLPANIVYIQNNIIKTNYGFHYDKNFRKMLISIIGINNLENLEDYLENYSGFLLQFKSILGSFTTTRNIAAHTYTPYAGATVTYQSPSVVLSNIRLITPILQKIENLIMRY
mgnify:FL=1